MVVDDELRTTVPHILTVGDCCTGYQFTHVAVYQGVLAVHNALNGTHQKVDFRVMPRATFTDPEVAWCGLTEPDATREGRPVKVARFAWAASGRAATLGRSDGLTKLVVDPETGRVLGAGIVGPGAGELIAEGALAVEAALTVEDLAATIHTHPTLAEGFMEAAESLLR